MYIYIEQLQKIIFSYSQLLSNTVSVKPADVPIGREYCRGSKCNISLQFFNENSSISFIIASWDNSQNVDNKLASLILWWMIIIKYRDRNEYYLYALNKLYN